MEGWEFSLWEDGLSIPLTPPTPYPTSDMEYLKCAFHNAWLYFTERENNIIVTLFWSAYYKSS